MTASDVTNSWFADYDARRTHDCAAGSTVLREKCLALFEKFERAHGFPQGWGQRLQLGGYK